MESADWSFDEVKTFENGLARFFHHVDKWAKIASMLPSRSLSEIISYYGQLEDDMRRIHEGADAGTVSDVSTPSASLCVQSGGSNGRGASNKRVKLEPLQDEPYIIPTTTPGDPQRKGVAWTQDEHRLFLLGLAKFGKGSWRSIARQFVVTRTPTQVASHAQKYFLRLNSIKDKKDKRRASIHDMTTDHITQGRLPAYASVSAH